MDNVWKCAQLLTMVLAAATAAPRRRGIRIGTGALLRVDRSRRISHRCEGQQRIRVASFASVLAPRKQRAATGARAGEERQSIRTR